MPNANYLKGRKKEYRVLHEARALTGHVALRSAGSHSPIDVVDIDTIERVVRFVQCKPDSMSQSKREAIMQENNALNGQFFCKFEVI